MYLCVVFPCCPARHPLSCFTTVRTPVLCICACVLSPIAYLEVFAKNATSPGLGTCNVSLLIEPSCGTTTVSPGCLLAGYATCSRDIRSGSAYHPVHTVLMLAPSYQSQFCGSVLGTTASPPQARLPKQPQWDQRKRGPRKGSGECRQVA